MYNNGLISGKFFEQLGFLLDKDDEQNVWELTAESLVFRRYQPIILEEALEEKGGYTRS